MTYRYLKIITEDIKKKRKTLGLPDDSPALVLMDGCKVHTCMQAWDQLISMDMNDHVCR